MEFIIGLLVGIAIGFIWGVWRATQSFIERVMERPEEIRDIMARIERLDREEEPSESEQHQGQIRAEFHHGVCYLYDHNEQFLAQGATVTEALAQAEQRFPNQKFEFRVNITKESSQNT
jgi:hypothetical protein